MSEIILIYKVPSLRHFVLATENELMNSSGTRKFDGIGIYFGGSVNKVC